MWLLCVNFLELTNEISRLFDQGCLWHLCQLRVELAVKLIKLLNLILHALTLTKKCEQFIFKLCVQLGLYIFDKVFDLLALVLLRPRHLLDRKLHVVHVLGQLLQPFLEANGFLFDDVAMLFVDLP